MRNDFVFNGKRWLAESVSGKGQAELHEFLDANTKASTTKFSNSPTIASSWTRPEVGLIKINVDADVSKGNNMVRTGAIAQ
ncbi:hypothetical protein RHMOL_Rhmol01G0087300 [Rhododendron molle]|uniref:Uncharacterized protein n=1 Tax=Rhododendron molle TaxID=49168 RepID=A0ACC0Q0V7_RHOML|nr:hypothetical protein RHMOL_Rhmol01G0087300 [Rhododendron molle]